MAGSDPPPPLAPEARRAHVRALDLLAVRARSAKQLAARLLEKGEAPEHVGAAIERLAAAGLVDDAGYAASRARAGVAKARSRRRMVEQLAHEGVARDVAKAAVDQAIVEDGGELAAALRAAEKKLRSLRNEEPAARRAKLYGYLARQGYESETVRQVLRRVLEVSPSDD